MNNFMMNPEYYESGNDNFNNYNGSYDSNISNDYNHYNDYNDYDDNVIVDLADYKRIIPRDRYYMTPKKFFKINCW